MTMPERNPHGFIDIFGKGVAGPVDPLAGRLAAQAEVPGMPEGDNASSVVGSGNGADASEGQPSGIKPTLAETSSSTGGDEAGEETGEREPVADWQSFSFPGIKDEKAGTDKGTADEGNGNNIGFVGSARDENQSEEPETEPQPEPVEAESEPEEEPEPADETEIESDDETQPEHIGPPRFVGPGRWQVRPPEPEPTPVEPEPAPEPIGTYDYGAFQPIDSTRQKPSGPPKDYSTVSGINPEDTPSGATFVAGTAESVDDLGKEKEAEEASKRPERPDPVSQFEAQLNMLESMGVIEPLSKGQKGIKGVNGKEYPAPDRDKLLKLMQDGQELFTNKIRAGFNRLLVVPFATSIEGLYSKYWQAVAQAAAQGPLVTTDGQPIDPDLLPKPQKSDDQNWSHGNIFGGQADSLVYGPKRFDAKHQGQTKREILDKLAEDDGLQGWQIVLVSGEEPTPGDIESNDAARRGLLNFLKRDRAHETDYTPEIWFADAMTWLNEGKVLDFNTKTLLKGTYLPNTNLIPSAGSGRLLSAGGHTFDVRLDGVTPTDTSDDLVRRTAVKL